MTETKNEKNGRKDALVVVDNSENALFLDTARFEQVWRVASMFSRSNIVPAQFQGKPENCMISIAMAARMNVDPMMMLQNSYIVHGRPGIEAKLAIALVNKSGLFTGPIQYKMGGTRYDAKGEGEPRSCTAYATLVSTGEKVEETVDMDMAHKMGWVSKKDSMWLRMPDQMLKYRSAMFFARLYCPEVLMGMQTIDELQEMSPQSKDISADTVDLRKTAAEPQDGFQEQSDSETTDQATETETADQPAQETEQSTISENPIENTFYEIWREADDEVKMRFSEITGGLTIDQLDGDDDKQAMLDQLKAMMQKRSA